jgi:glycerate kinase
VAEARIRVACDVTNPLLGLEGAARVYAPQKGATPEAVESLEANLGHFAEVIQRKTGLDVDAIPGAGAAGGLGAGLVAFAGASLCRGVQLTAQAVRLRERLTGADLCLTGEGRLDAQTAHGKAAFGVAEIARSAGVPCVCIPGSAAADGPVGAFAAVWPLVAGEVTPRLALQHPAMLLRQRAAEAVRELAR